MSDQRTVAITGASGLVGSELTKSFEKDQIRVLRLVRTASDEPNTVHWDPESEVSDISQLEGVDAVIHLAGENIAKKRWTASFKKKIADSRVVGTKTLSEALAGLQHKPRTLVCASAIGFYGDRGHEVLTEESPVGLGFLADTCQQWENASQAAWEAGIRVAQVRIGVVLSPDGGALEKMLPIFRKGLGGPAGSGDQIISWVALPDLVRLLRFVVDNDALHGAVNGTAPQPVSNKEFSSALGRAVNRPAILPAPAFALRLALGEAAGPLVLESADVRPKRLEEVGFEFETPDIDSALKRVLTTAD